MTGRSGRLSLGESRVIIIIIITRLGTDYWTGVDTCMNNNTGLL